MDYFEKRNHFKERFNTILKDNQIEAKRTSFSPHFAITENNLEEHGVATGSVDHADELTKLFLKPIKKFNKDTFISQLKKIILKYSKLLNLDVEFFNASTSTLIELNLDYKDLYDISSVSFMVKGTSKKTRFTTFHFDACFNDVEPNYEIVELDGKSVENQSLVVITVNYKKVEDIVIPMLTAHTDVISELLGYEVTHVDKDIISVLDMIKI